MNERGRVEYVARSPAHREGLPAEKLARSRTVAVAIQGALAIATLCTGPAMAQPATRQFASSALAQAPVGALKRSYLQCDQVSSQERMTLAAAAYCSAVSDELLRREFRGDLDLMLAWWRSQRRAPTPD